MTDRSQVSGLPSSLLVDDVGPYQRDWWPLAQKRELVGEALPIPAAVLRPDSTATARDAVVAAARSGVSIVPFGLGSGVVGAAGASSEAVTITTDAMTEILGLDEVNQTVTVQAGVRGSDLEAVLNERGYTVAHYPQSIALSSVGGWVATRASGTFSSKYGNIEDLLVAVEVVLADGSVVTIGDPARSSTGPDLRQLFLGSEGAFGLITAVTLGIRRLPEDRRFAAFRFPHLGRGLDTVRELMQTDLAPSLCRLYDVGASTRFEPNSELPIVLVVAWDGPSRVVDEWEALTSQTVERSGGANVGDGPARQWWDNRYDVSRIERAIETEGMIGDTIEVSTRWSNAERLHGAMAQTFADAGADAGCHFSHVYIHGTSLYWTFTLSAEPRELEQRYSALWADLLDVTDANEGNLSHHHGLGRLRAARQREADPDGHRLLNAIKRGLDPDSVFAPGALGLGEYPTT